MKRKVVVVILLFLAIVTGASVVASKISPRRTIEDYALRILDTCAQEPFTQACYTREVPKLMDHLTMEEAFAVTQKIQDQDSTFGYCHVLGHELSARETKKNSAQWKEVITRCPSGVCSNGCVHGAFQERFRTDAFSPSQIEGIMPDLTSVCEPRGTWQPTGMEQASCYHALGHLLMYITTASTLQSTALCNRVADKGTEGNFTRVCYDGVFMQIFQPLEPEDFALIKGKQPTRTEHSAFCAPFKGTVPWVSCWTEGWPLYFGDLREPNNLVQFCSQVPQKDQLQCYNALIYVLVPQFQFDLTTMKSYCLDLPPQWRGRCFANTASRLIETDWKNISRAASWCAEIAQYDRAGDCFAELVTYSTFNFHEGSPEFYHLCGALPEPWKAKCFNQEEEKQ